MGASKLVSKFRNFNLRVYYNRIYGKIKCKCKNFKRKCCGDQNRFYGSLSVRENVVEIKVPRGFVAICNTIVEYYCR